MLKQSLDGTGSLKIIALENLQKVKTDQKSPFFNLSQLAERIAVRFTIFARLYFNIFYRSMLAREIALANLKPGASVLHIGGGAYPYTAMFLARKGYRVHACDCDSTAVDISNKLVEKSGLGDRISIFYENGCMVNSSNYDAVWVSLNICPKRKVLDQAWESLRKGGILVYRKFPAWLALFGKRDVSFPGDEWSKIKKARSVLGAESLVIEKASSFAEDSEKISTIN